MFKFGKCRVPAKGWKNDKIIRKIIEVRPVTLGSTHDDDKKYKYSFLEVQLSREVLEK
jgi:hypothetical protein